MSELNNLQSFDSYINESINDDDDILFEEDAVFVVNDDEIFEAGLRRTARQKKQSGIAGAIVKELKKDGLFKTTEEKLKKIAIKLIPKMAKELHISPAKAKKALNKISIQLK